MTAFLLTFLTIVNLRGESSVSAFQPSRTAHPRIITNTIVAPRRHNRVQQIASRREYFNPLSMNNGSESEDSVSTIFGVSGIIAQPIVWISLYFVATTGGGLPAGPFGLIGGLEGLAYVAVVVLAAASIGKKVMGVESSSSSSGYSPIVLAERISFVTLVLALLTLMSLVVQQGCVPNAKPILDYSAYLHVCNPDETPGFFGSS